MDRMITGNDVQYGTVIDRLREILDSLTILDRESRPRCVLCKTESHNLLDCRHSDQLNLQSVILEIRTNSISPSISSPSLGMRFSSLLPSIIFRDLCDYCVFRRHSYEGLLLILVLVLIQMIPCLRGFHLRLRHRTFLSFCSDS